MTLTWYGHSCFKIVGNAGQITIITDPFDKSAGLTPPRGNADIITVSHNHFDHNNVKAINGDPFVVDGPGEYEIKGVKIVGCQSFHDDKQGKERGTNTIYLLEVDKIRLCHLGDFGQDSLTDSQLEAIGETDILLAPVGGETTIDAEKAVKIAEKIEPFIIIPMHFHLPNLKFKLAKVDDFLKEMGIEKKAAVDKLTLKKKDLSGEKMKVVLMKL